MVAVPEPENVLRCHEAKIHPIIHARHGTLAEDKDGSLFATNRHGKGSPNQTSNGRPLGRLSSGLKLHFASGRLAGPGNTFCPEIHIPCRRACFFPSSGPELSPRCTDQLCR